LKLEDEVEVEVEVESKNENEVEGRAPLRRAGRLRSVVL
jgi:hypothetical protein